MPLGGGLHYLYEMQDDLPKGVTLTATLAAQSRIKIGLVMGLGLFALSGCIKPPAPPQAAMAPPPVGHTYATLVAVPPPVLRRVKITPAQHEQLQQAFNVIGLKSALMVGALSCEQQDKYDTFMTQFHTHILADQHMMDAYFRRTGGRNGQTSEDQFVTLLANNQSVSGIADGKTFCLNNAAEFAAVLALHTTDQLDQFVTDQAPSETLAASNQN